MSGLSTKPGCELPLTVTGCVMPGSGEAGAMVRTPVPMLKLMVSAAAVALAWLMASRSEPAPLSLVLVTVNVAAWAVCTPSHTRTIRVGNVFMVAPHFVHHRGHSLRACHSERSAAESRNLVVGVPPLLSTARFLDSAALRSE